MTPDCEDPAGPDPEQIEREIHDDVKHCRLVVRQYRRRLLELSQTEQPAIPLNDPEAEV